MAQAQLFRSTIPEQVRRNGRKLCPLPSAHNQQPAHNLMTLCCLLHEFPPFTISCSSRLSHCCCSFRSALQSQIHNSVQLIAACALTATHFVVSNIPNCKTHFDNSMSSACSSVAKVQFVEVRAALCAMCACACVLHIEIIFHMCALLLDDLFPSDAALYYAPSSPTTYDTDNIHRHRQR